jgi:hypothetical protein
VGSDVIYINLLGYATGRLSVGICPHLKGDGRHLEEKQAVLQSAQGLFTTKPQ